MGVRYRKDANLAIAAMQVELDNLAKSYIARGDDLVQTVGILNSDREFNHANQAVYENALTKVSPFGYFSLDIRSCSQHVLRRYMRETKQLIESVADQYDVKVKIEDLPSFDPIENLDKELQEVIESVCIDFNYKYKYMISGGFHDLGILADQKRRNGSKVPCGLIFIPCRNGISHNPKEYTSAESIQKGAMVLAHTVIELAILKS